MPPIYNADARFAAPARRHTLTPGAASAVEAVRRFAHKRNRERRNAELVSRHGQKKRDHDKPMPASAIQLMRDAEAAGFEVKASRGWWTLNIGKSNEYDAPSWQIAGIDRERRLGFRAIWANGTAKEGGWYAPRVQWLGIAVVKANIAALIPPKKGKRS